MNGPRSYKFVALYGLVFVVALTVRLVYWSEIRGTPLDQWHLLPESDMATYVEQARQLAAGDWLAPNPYHPYHRWQHGSGTAAEWLAWYGPHGFHQAPLYSYVLAAASKATSDYIDAAKITQLALGAGTCVLLALIARQLAGEVAGVSAGLFCVFYGPLYYLEAQILREGPAIFGLALLVWLVLRYVRVDASRRRLMPAAIGIFLGVFAMFHEFALVLFVATLIILFAHDARRSFRGAAATLSLLAVGWLVGFAPLLVRNLAVGAPPQSVSSRSHLTLALANMSSAKDGGVMFSEPGPQFREIMLASNGSTWAVLREVWRGYEGNPGRLVANWARRLVAAFVSVEIADNTSFSFYRACAPVLRICVTFAWILPLGLSAILACLAAATGDRLRPAPACARPVRPISSIWSEHRTAHHTLLTYQLLFLLAVSLVNVQARYRMLIVPILICYAGVFIAIVVRSLAARRFAPPLALMAVATAIVVAQYRLSIPLRRLDRRVIDRAFVAERYEQAGQFADALPYLRAALVLTPDDHEVRLHYANDLAQLRRYDEALAQFRRLESTNVQPEGVRNAIRFLEQKVRTESQPAR